MTRYGFQIFAILAFMGVCGALTAQEPAFDRVEYNRQLSAVAAEWQQPGSDRDTLAGQFINLHNTMIATCPEHNEDILRTTHRVASRYGIRYVLSGEKLTEAEWTRAHPVDALREVFMVAEEMPRFPGCEETVGSLQKKRDCAHRHLLNYVDQHLQYPEKAMAVGLEGRILAQFVVEPDGMLSQIEVIRGLGYGCDEEVVRVIRSMNDMEDRWIPGRQRGKAVPVRYTLPVKFKLPRKK